jgi:diguanylate cyclase (GGDEF)-like protein
LLVAILAILPLAIVWFAYVSSGSTLDKTKHLFAREVFRTAAADVADLTSEYLTPLVIATDLVARQLDDDVIGSSPPETIENYLLTTLSSSDRTIGITWQGTDGTVFGARQDGSRLVTTHFDPNADEPAITTQWRSESGGVLAETVTTGTPEVTNPLLLAQSEVDSFAHAVSTAQDGTTPILTLASTSPSRAGTVLVEIDLTHLTSFLAPYAPTASSRLFIAAGSDLVVHARPALIEGATAGSEVTLLPDRPTAAGGALTTGGDGWQELTLDDATYHGVSRSVPGLPAFDWTVVAIGPEDDLSPQFESLRETDKLYFGALAILSILLAIPLARMAVRDVGSLHTAAHRDSLTGLLNRRTFEKHGATMVANARRRRRSVGALMVDIDHFKDLNDTYGHHAGDEILEAIAGRISHSVAKTDLVARLGGDELALLLEGADLAATRSVAARLKNAVTSTPISTHRGPVYVTVSIGASATDTMDRARFDDLLKAADRALYASKRAGRDRVTAVEIARTH